MSEMVGQRVDYQLMLRGTGAYLDRYRASSIAVIEMPDGFALRYQEDGKKRTSDGATPAHMHDYAGKPTDVTRPADSRPGLSPLRS